MLTSNFLDYIGACYPRQGSAYPLQGHIQRSLLAVRTSQLHVALAVDQCRLQDHTLHGKTYQDTSVKRKSAPVKGVGPSIEH